MHSTTEGSLAGTHAQLPDAALLVGPTVDREFNTLKVGLVPIACWRVEDIRFDFASSFVRPEIAHELQSLWSLREQHKQEAAASGDGKDLLKKVYRYPPLSIFGHADPVGEDEFNKQLSGRRAKVIYALLTRRTDLWEELYSQPLANDQWGEPAICTMQQHLGRTVTGKADTAARRALFKAYMDALCTIRDEAGNPLQDEGGSPAVLLLDKEKDFLAQGRDGTGKGDFQGCSEFNPVLIFSQEEDEKYAAASDKSERNQENGPNRRVMVLLFRVGTKVEPAKWPCPCAQEATGGCRKRFWSDEATRRGKRLAGTRRTLQTTGDTFACRFYDRLLSRSPCEEVQRRTHPCFVFIKLLDDSSDTPLETRDYSLRSLHRDLVLSGQTDAAGLLRHENLPDDSFELQVGGKTEVVEVYYMDEKDCYDGKPWFLRMRGLSS